MITPEEEDYIKSLKLAKSAEEKLRKAWFEETKKSRFYVALKPQLKFGVMDFLITACVIAMIWNVLSPGNKDVRLIVELSYYFSWVVIIGVIVLLMEVRQILSGKINLLYRKAVRYYGKPKQSWWLMLIHKSSMPLLVVSLFFNGFTRTATCIGVLAIALLVCSQIVASKVGKKLAGLAEV